MNGKIILDILSEEGWLLNLSFLVDITHHLNKLCSKILGGSQLITDLVCAIDAFENKLSLFQKQLSSGNIMYFQSMSSFASNCNSNFFLDFRKYAHYCQDPGESFLKKFQDLNERAVELSLL